MADSPFFRDDVEQVANAMDDMAGSTLDPHYKAARILWHFAKQCPQMSDIEHAADKKPREVA